MKKFLTMLAVAVLFAVMCAAQVCAWTGPVGNVAIMYGSPTLDGVLSQGEWSLRSEIIISEDNASPLDRYCKLPYKSVFCLG